MSWNTVLEAVALFRAEPVPHGSCACMGSARSNLPRASSSLEVRLLMRPSRSWNSPFKAFSAALPAMAMFSRSSALSVARVSVNSFCMPTLCAVRASVHSLHADVVVLEVAHGSVLETLHAVHDPLDFEVEVGDELGGGVDDSGAYLVLDTAHEEVSGRHQRLHPGLEVLRPRVHLLLDVVDLLQPFVVELPGMEDERGHAREAMVLRVHGVFGVVRAPRVVHEDVVDALHGFLVMPLEELVAARQLEVIEYDVVWSGLPLERVVQTFRSRAGVLRLLTAATITGVRRHRNPRIAGRGSGHFGSADFTGKESLRYRS